MYPGQITCQLEMLLLIFADRHKVRLIKEDVGRHQYGISEKADPRPFAVSFGLVLKLGHPF